VLADAYGRMPTEDDRRMSNARMTLMGAQTEQARAQAEAARARSTQAGPATPGQQAADREFGKEYVDWKARGSYADVQKQTEQLNAVLGALESGRDITGPVVGAVPDWMAAMW